MKFKHVVLIIFVIIILYFAWCSSKSVLITNNVRQKRTNFLFLGVDFVDRAVHSDTTIFVSYSPKYQVVDVISIPRDTYIDVEFTKFKKLTEIYAYFYAKTKSKKLAAEELKKIVKEKLFCSSTTTKIEIPYYFVIDYQNFKKFIDTIGKIKIVVNEPMHYDDNAGNLHIHFEPGVYYMNGEEVLKYVRYRGQDTDINRIKRQQEFIKSLVSKIFNPLSFYKLPLIIYNFDKCFITNLSFWEILNLMLEVRNLRLTDIRFSTLLGTTTGRYLEVDREQLDNLIKYLSNNNSKIEQKKEYVVLKIYNATNYPKMAKQVAMFLRQKGYDVISWSNWPTTQYKSIVIDYSQNLELVNSLCSLLNISDVTSVFEQNSTGLQQNILIILGQDFIEKNKDNTQLQYFQLYSE